MRVLHWLRCWTNWSCCYSLSKTLSPKTHLIKFRQSEKESVKIETLASECSTDSIQPNGLSLPSDPLHSTSLGFTRGWYPFWEWRWHTFIVSPDPQMHNEEQPCHPGVKRIKLMRYITTPSEPSLITDWSKYLDVLFPCDFICPD